MDNIEVGKVLAHIQEANALTALRSDWKAIFDYNLYGDPSLSLFGAKPKANNDIVFLLDGSGSMLSEGKWEAAKDGAVLFYQLMKELRHSAFQDRYNNVVFRWLCMEDTDTTTTIPPGTGLKDITTPLSMGTFGPYLPEHNYCTPIGRGLETAIDQFDLDTEESFYSNKTVLLLSDGKQNRGIDPAVVTIPEEILVHAVGLGEDYIEPETIQDIADASGADYRITPSPRVMKDFFIQILCSTSWKLQDITVIGDAASIDQSKVIFIVVWDDPTASLTFELDPPGGGPNITPLNLAAYFPMVCSYHGPAAGETHAYYVCENVPNGLLGEWHFANINDGGVPVPLADVLLKVVEDPLVIADFDIENITHYTSQPVMLSVRITEDGKALTGLTEVYAELVSSPALAVGDLMAKNTPPPDYPSQPPAKKDLTVRSHYLLGVMEKLGIKSLSKPGGPKIYLRDNGLGGDLKADDGIYTYIFTNTQYEGSYTFKFRARGQNKLGIIFDRTETLSDYIKFAAGVNQTKVDTLSTVTDPQKRLIKATIRVIPRDSYGSYLGPFRGGLIQLWSSSGSFEKGFVDNKNGSYDFKLNYPVDAAPLISVSVGDMIVADRKEVREKAASDKGFSFHIGSAIPGGNFSNNYDQSYSIGLNFDYHFTPQLSMVGLLDYNHFKAATSSLSDTYWWSISANLKYAFSQGILRPYGNLGPGFYIPEKGSAEGGFNIGLGLDYSLTSEWIMELGVDYHQIFTGGDDTKFSVQHIGLIYGF